MLRFFIPRIVLCVFVFNFVGLQMAAWHEWFAHLIKRLDWGVSSIMDQHNQLKFGIIIFELYSPVDTFDLGLEDVFHTFLTVLSFIVLF